MNKVFVRDAVRGTVKQLPDPHEVLPRLPDDVTVPDDARELTEPARKGGRRPASGIRWMRWIPAVILLVAGAVAAAVFLRSDSTETVVSETVPWIVVTTGPGSNSLAPTGLTAEMIPWTSPTTGPGSNSLAPTGLTAEMIPWTSPTAGPGSNSLTP